MLDGNARTDCKSAEKGGKSKSVSFLNILPSFTKPSKTVTVKSCSSQSRLINTMTALGAWTLMTC